MDSFEEVEKLEWWFEQDIDDEGEENEEDGGGDKTRTRRFKKERKSWNEMILHHLHQWCHPTDEMRMYDLNWWRRS
nr:hypothetical protein [Tanacetum cinerariifolium]